MRRSAGVILLVVAAALPGRAQPTPPRLHRNLPGDLDLEHLPPVGSPAPAPLPTASSSAPRAPATPGGGTSASDVLQTRPSWEPQVRELDRNTRSPAGATLQYREVFDPAVAPFKRAGAYDAVDEFGRLVVRSPAPVPLFADGSPSWGAEPVTRFTGDVLVQLSPRAPTPLPSVGAEERLVSYHTEPSVPVRFFRDSAGNLLALGGAERVVRIVYVLEAPEHAFVAPRVPSVGLDARPEGVPAPAAPAFLNTAAEPVLRAIGVSRGDPLDVVLGRAVAYFRAFRDDDLPSPPSSNLYADLALGRVGACRHRAYAFMLTMHALGVPTRYVHNEAHAWVEVAIPEVGWTRVDLGGWDVNFHAEAPTRREVHIPSNPDPFPRPAEYANDYSILSGARGNGERNPRHAAPTIHPTTTTNLDPSSNAQEDPDGQPGESPSNPQGNTPGNATNGAGGAGGAGATGRGRGVGGTGRAGTSEDFSATTEGPGEATAERPPDEAPPLLRTTLALTSAHPDQPSATPETGFVRGSLVVCAGEARDEHRAPVGDLPVEIHLVRDGQVVQTLGTTVTRADGRFEARVLLPMQLRVGSYALRASTPGDARHQGAVGD